MPELSLEEVKPSALTAEMVAGLRHARYKTPETAALSTAMGRMLSRLLTMVAPHDVVNTGNVRSDAFAYLIGQNFPPEAVSQPVYVEVASGYALRPLLMARQYPHARFIEVDVPAVIADKQERYAKANIDLPPNLEFRSDDLTQQPLASILDGQQAHMVVAEGLLIYLEHDYIRQLSHNLLTGMADGAHFVAEIVYASKQDLNAVGGIVRAIRRNTGSDVARGRVESKEQGLELLRSSGYADSNVYIFDDLQAEADLEKAYRNLLLLLHGRKGSASTDTPSKPPEETETT